MSQDVQAGAVDEPIRGRIGVLIEDHFDQTEFRKYNEFFPAHGYQVVYLSHLWGNDRLTFGCNPDNGLIEEQVVVNTDVDAVEPSDFKGILVIGAYATDRLRYQVKPEKGKPNTAPAVAFLRKAMNDQVKVGTICHALWLFCADRRLLADRTVTCAHNIICDVENAGAEVVYGDDGTADLVVDGNLISAKHPAVVDRFLERFLAAVEGRS